MSLKVVFEETGVSKGKRRPFYLGREKHKSLLVRKVYMYVEQRQLVTKCGSVQVSTMVLDLKRLDIRKESVT